MKRFEVATIIVLNIVINDIILPITENKPKSLTPNACKANLVVNKPVTVIIASLK